MTVRNRSIRGSVSSEHIVQFFDTDESRARNVAAFLADGFEAGEPLIVIARPMSWAGISEQLALRGVPVQSLLAQGTLVVKEASETLRQLSRHGVPDQPLFEHTIGRPAAAMARKGTLRAYGEMVDLLAQRGDLNDAVKLEAFWNDLGERVPMFLMCGYCAAHFVSPGSHRALLEICTSHSDVHRDPHDPLGNWVLNAAHNGTGSRESLRH